MHQRKSAAAMKRPQAGELARLASELGTRKGLDPIPPDQYLTYMGDEYPEPLRLWAWVLSKTIRLGHRCASCVDDRGRALTLADAARELKMDPANTRRAWRWLESQKRVRREGPHLVLAGEIQGGEQKAGRSVQTLPPFLRLLPKLAQTALAALPQAQKDELTTELAALQEKRSTLESQSIAYARYVSDCAIDSVCLRFGIKRRFGPDRAPVPHPFEPGGVVAARGGHVQTWVSTSPGNEHVPPAVSLLERDSSEKPNPLPPSRKRAGGGDKSQNAECPRCQGEGVYYYTHTQENGGVGFTSSMRWRFCSCTAGVKLQQTEPGAVDELNARWS